MQLARESRMRLLLHAAGALAFGGWSLLAWESRREGEGAAILPILLAIIALAWLALGTAWWAARHLRRVEVLRALWLWGVLFRVAGFLGAPILEDDWARYLWDGREFALTGNPYGKPPAAYFGDAIVPGEFRRVLDEINHPQLPTIYGPGCQLAFVASYLIAPARLWPLKLILLSADLLVVALLLRFVSPRAVLLYAWCPLVVQETAFTAHPDVLWVLAVIAAMHALESERAARAAICCGLAVTTKIFALLLVPFFLVRLAWKYSVLAAATTIAIYLPFWLRGNTADLAGLRAMGGDWQFNATIFATIANASNGVVARVITLTAFAAIWLWLFICWQRNTIASTPRGDLVLGVFFLLSAVVNPWYLVGLAPFVALRPSAWGVAALAAVSLSYVHGLNINEPTLAPYEHPTWVRPTEAGMVLLGVALGVASRLGLFATTKRDRD